MAPFEDSEREARHSENLERRYSERMRSEQFVIPMELGLRSGSNTFLATEESHILRLRYQPEAAQSFLHFIRTHAIIYQ